MGDTLKFVTKADVNPGDLAIEIKDAIAPSRDLDLKIAVATGFFDTTSTKALPPCSASVDAVLKVASTYLTTPLVFDLRTFENGAAYATVGGHPGFGHSPALALCAALMRVVADRRDHESVTGKPVA